MNEHLIWVDLFDREIGHGEKLDTHVKEQLHRAFSVFLIHNGKMLIQRRELSKYHSGGLWANSCCSHPRYGESFETSVQNRLEVELGIPKGSCTPEELFSFVYYAKFDGLSEYEFDHVLLGRIDRDTPLSPDPAEADATQWMSVEELESQLTQTPEKFTPWFITAAPIALEALKK